MRPARSTQPRINCDVSPRTRRALLDSIDLQSALSGDCCTIGDVLDSAVGTYRRALIDRAQRAGMDTAAILARRDRHPETPAERELPPELLGVDSFVD